MQIPFLIETLKHIYVYTSNELIGSQFQYFLASNYTSFHPQIYYPNEAYKLELHSFKVISRPPIEVIKNQLREVRGHGFNKTERGKYRHEKTIEKLLVFFLCEIYFWIMNFKANTMNISPVQSDLTRNRNSLLARWRASRFQRTLRMGSSLDAPVNKALTQFDNRGIY